MARGTMDPARVVKFSDPDLSLTLQVLDVPALDQLEFGVIGFDREGVVTIYDHAESAATGLRRADVMNRPLSTEVDQCMNNYLVALRFEETADAGSDLDTTAWAGFAAQCLFSPA